MKFADTFLTIPKIALLASLFPLSASAIIIQIDETYDTGGYFGSGTAERARLDDAVNFFEGILADDLDAITPTGDYASNQIDSWSVDFTNPSTGGVEFVDNLVVPADTIIIYVGARNLPGSQIGDGGYGSFDSIAISGSAFDEAVKTRGESGVGTTDFAPWGGYLAVDNVITWDTTLSGNGGSDQHLYSTLLHEVGHALGLGTAASWNAQVSSARFTGTQSNLDQGEDPRLWFDSSTSTYPHWRNDEIFSNIYGTSTSQEAAMDPSIIGGQVKFFTELDVAALDDIGWDIIAPIPEPSQAALLGLGLIALAARRRR